MESQANEEAQDVVIKLKRLRKQQQNLRAEGEKHLDIIGPVLSQVGQFAQEIQDLEATREVIMILLNVEEASNVVKKRIAGEDFTDHVISDSLARHQQLQDIYELVAASPAYPPEVVKYAEAHTRGVFSLLEEHLARRFNEAMERIGWPTPKDKLQPGQWTEGNSIFFKKTFADLLTLQNPYDLKPVSLISLELIIISFFLA